MTGRPEHETAAASLAATTLAQFVRLESCERYLWYRLHPKETRELFRTYRVTEQPLTPLLSEKGARHETEITEELRAEGRVLVDLTEQDVDATVAELARGVHEARVLLQARVEGTIGTFPASGIADLVIVEPGDNGRVRVTVGDAKASRRDRPEHRIQVAFYALLIRELAESAGVEIEEMSGCIWRVPQGPDDEQPAVFDLRAYEGQVGLRPRILSKRLVKRHCRTLAQARNDILGQLTARGGWECPGLSPICSSTSTPRASATTDSGCES